MMNLILYLKVWAHKITDRVASEHYKGEGNPAPSMLKRKTVAAYAKNCRCNILIESGTYLGEMVEYQEKNFDKIFSIEIADIFYEFSSKRLKKHKNISILKGDSSTVLGKVCKKISQDDRVLFWLDGHYSGGQTGKGEKECPIYEELTNIFETRADQDAILIDDARCFNGEGDYPALPELCMFIKQERKNANIEIKDDMIRVILAGNPKLGNIK